MGWRAFLFLTFGLFHCAGNLAARPTCEELVAAFAPEDFAHSGMYAGRGQLQPQAFPEWAAKTTEELRTGIRAKRSWSALLELAAERRQDLAQVLGDWPWNVGRFRSGRLEHVIGMSRIASEPDRKQAVQEARIADSPLRQELANLALGLVDAKLWPSIFPRSKHVRMGQRSYVGIDGNTIGVTEFFVEYDGPDHGLVRIRSPHHKFVDLILDDVFKRIDRAAAATDPVAKEREFYAAIYGYYQACPFDRGTAAIGQVFWSAVAAEVTGRKWVLPDGADVRAMLMEQQAFIDWMSAQTKPPASETPAR